MRKDEIRTQKILRKLNKKEEKKKRRERYYEEDVLEPRILGGCLVLVAGFMTFLIYFLIKFLF